MILSPRHIITLGLASLLVGGCRDLPELSYETEHLHIGTDFDAPLCRGDLEHYERFIATLETEFGTTVDKKINVYIWDLREGSEPTWCDEGQAGCFSRGRIYAEVGSVEHELVHAVVDTFAAPSRFWSEGAAEAVQVWRTRFGSHTPGEDVDKGPQDEPNYETAGHFSRWLIETRGMAQYRELLRSPGDGRAAFEDTYDISFDDAEADYFENAPDSYGAFVSCDELPLAQADELVWSQTVAIDCSESGVHGDLTGLFAHRILTITQRGLYTFSTNSDGGTIARCPDGTYTEPPTLDDPEQYGDLPEYTKEWFTGYSRGLSGSDESTTLDLVPGRYRVIFGYESFEANTATLEVVAADVP